jgi:hypothetical protein
LWIFDNAIRLLSDNLKRELPGASRFRVAAACFSIYAFDALKCEWGKLKEFGPVFTLSALCQTERYISVF